MGSKERWRHERHRVSSPKLICRNNPIFTIRGVQVMLDSDIAALFQVDVKRLNEQRKRNQGRFPVDFCFRITKEERNCLRSQIATFTERTRDRKYLPYVYTEQGIIALAEVFFILQ